MSSSNTRQVLLRWSGEGLAFHGGADEGVPITVDGDGQLERDFTFVDDLACGTVAATRPLGYQVINLGNDRPTKIADVITMIEDCM